MEQHKKPASIRLALPADAPDMAEVIMRSWEVAYRDILPAEFIRQKNAARPEQYARSITGEISIPKKEAKHVPDQLESGL